MEKKPSQNDTEIHNPEINNTGSNSFEGVPDDVVFVILPFLRCQDMVNLASVNREFRRIITNAFTNPNMYTAYPGMFEALCKFWHENPVAFNKWFKLYRIDKIQTEPHGVKQRDQACDYIFNAFQLTDGSVDRNILNNALGTVFQNSTDDITQFLLPLVFNANKFALYSRFGNTTLQEPLEAQINTWTTETKASRENIHALLFCLLTSQDIAFFIGKRQILNPMLDYVESNIEKIFGQDTIKKHGEGFIKALLQSCRLTLDAANVTQPTAGAINAIRKAFPNIPINFAGADLWVDEDLWDLTGANLIGANLTNAKLRAAYLMDANLSRANLTNANLTHADLSYANLSRANLTGANLTSAYLPGVNLTGADLKGAGLTRANLGGADLTWANLTGAYLGCANLINAKLSGADLTDAELFSANLEGANLTGVNFTGAKLTGAYLSSANLSSANLTRADLWRANLTNANLTRADLWGAHLADANLRGANLTRANLFECKLSADAKLDGITINSTALLSVFIDGKNPPNTTTNIWSLNDKMLGAFKLLLPHAEIKELKLLMEDVKNQISVDPLDFIFGALKKAKLLKLISNEIAKKQAPQKMECEKPTQKAAISEKPKQSEDAINSTLALPKQSQNTISFNP